MSGLWSLAAPLIWALDPEKAHELALKALASGMVPRTAPRPAAELRIHLFGMDFANPLGMAAGFDKNAEVPDALFDLGFGHCEVGTVTPRPQRGNARPRMFRLPEDRAVVNRLGFNNQGHRAMRSRLEDRAGNGGIVGVNLGANKDSTDRVADFVQGMEIFHDFASYITINVSSPNTPGLRNLQLGDELVELVSRVMAARHGVGGQPPVLLKIAPDLSDHELETIFSACLAGGISGIIVGNTTITRPALRSPRGKEEGGLSGRPLFDLSTSRLARLYQISGGQLPLIGVGGVDSAEAAWRKITAGASLVQLYTGLVYEGPALAGRICAGLSGYLKQAGFSTISRAVGTRATEWLTE